MVEMVGAYAVSYTHLLPVFFVSTVKTHNVVRQELYAAFGKLGGVKIKGQIGP